ncbi:LOW QUALITY PROTEIN: hypothetical protein JCM19038_3506 [Geomicrobium sp. JCM 19038]|nr:LOW QUALITY PROTEIN: hypothetical protein JCM19038_3506 [Geomicrobium sp. JCM 19038]
MNFRVDAFTQFALSTTDDEFGTVNDVYFDSVGNWKVRYIIADTRPWFFGGKVILSPDSVERMEIDAQLLHLSATKEEIKDSPKPDEKEPISRTHEERILSHYGLPYYWTAPGGMAQSAHTLIRLVPYSPVAVEAVIESEEAQISEETTEDVNYHLQSSKDLTSYSVYARGEKIGKIDDIVFDSRTWQVEFIEVNTGTALKKTHHLIPVQKFKEFDPTTERAHVDIDLEKLKDAPTHEQLTDEHKKGINKYYGMSGMSGL